MKLKTIAELIEFYPKAIPGGANTSLIRMHNEECVISHIKHRHDFFHMVLIKTASSGYKAYVVFKGDKKLYETRVAYRKDLIDFFDYPDETERKIFDKEEYEKAKISAFTKGL